MDIATIVSNINTLVAEAVAAASAPLQANINSLNITVQNKNALLATRDATIVQLTADFDAYKLTHPDTTTGDNVAPSIPVGLTAVAAPASQVNLTWTASTDNVGVTGYNVFRNNVQIATPTGTSYSDTGLTAETTYSYTVKAHDAAGNLSANSVAASVTTTGTVTPPSATWWKDIIAAAGAKGTLTKYTGTRDITVAGTVLKNLDITGGLRILADNVTIQNCRINSGNAFWGIDADGKKGFKLIQSTVTGPGFSGDSQGVLGSGEFTGNDVSGYMHNIALQSLPCTVKRNYLHDGGSNNVDPHIGCLSLKGGNFHVVIEDNVMEGMDTSCIFLQDNFGAIDDVLINHNRLTGNPDPNDPTKYVSKPGFTIYVESRLGKGTTNVRITNNEIGKGGWANASDGAYVTYNLTNPVVPKPITSGNVDAVTLKAITV